MDHKATDESFAELRVGLALNSLLNRNIPRVLEHQLKDAITFVR
jgi:hypothetical protein